MATKFPIEMITTLSGAKSYSPLIWNGTDLEVSKNEDYNLADIVNKITKVTTEFNDFKSTNSNALSQVIGISIDLSAIKPKITIFETQIANIEKEMINFNTLLATYAGRINPIEVKVGDLGNNIIAFLSDITSIRSAYAEMEARVQFLENSGSLSARVGILESSISDLRSRVEPIETNLTATLSSIQTLTVQLSSIDARLSSLESTLSALQTQVSSIR